MNPQSEPDISQYEYVDTAFGGVNRRNNVQKITDVHLNGVADCYASHNRATIDLLTWRNSHQNKHGKPTVEGFDGPTRADNAHLDFDHEPDPTVALGWLRRVLDKLEVVGVDLNALGIWFSGSKGFHVEMPEVLFGGFTPSREFHRRLKRLAELILDDIPFDSGVYDALRLWRLPNSKHRKTGLYKIPLTIEEARTLTIEQIRTLAQTPREIPVRDREWQPVPALVDFWDATITDDESTDRTEPRAPTDDARDRQTIAAIATSWPYDGENVIEGGDHVSRHTDYLLPVIGALVRHTSAEHASDLVMAAAAQAGDQTFLSRDWQDEIDRIAANSAQRVSGAGTGGVYGLPALGKQFPVLADVLGALWVQAGPRIGIKSRAKSTVPARAQIVRLSEVKPEKVTWIWRGRIPRGKLTIIEGDPGNGKSGLTLDIAARLTRGDPMPDGTRGDAGGTGGVVLLSGEDGLADTIRPRLDAAGADCSKIVALTMVTDGTVDRLPTLEDVEAIKEAVKAVDAELVVIDPVMAYVPSERDAHKDQQVRAVLSRVAKLAEELSIAFIVVRHLTKAEGGNPLYRGQGSIAFTGQARSVMVVAPDPDDDSQNKRRVLAHSKCNVGELQPSLTYDLVGRGGYDALGIDWGATSKHSAETILNRPQQTGDDDRREERKNALDVARDIIHQMLANGAVDSEEAEAEAKAQGVSQNMIDRKAKELGFKRRKIGFSKPTKWVWELLPPKNDDD